MAMVVKNNMSAVRTLNTLNTNSSALQKSLAKVSSGMKINSAQDDASGYAISERMRVQIRSLDQANQNTQNASSLMKTAEGAVSSTVEILKTLKEKAINAATDTNTDQDRATIQKELDQYIDQIDDNALTTFNGKYLVDGSKSQEGKAVATAMTNQSLSTDTTDSTALVELKNRNGENLEISSTDSVTASYVMNGYTYTTKMDITSKTTLSEVLTTLNSVTANSGAGGASGPSPEEVQNAANAILGADEADLLAVAKADSSSTTDAEAIAGDDNKKAIVTNAQISGAPAKVDEQLDSSVAGSAAKALADKIASLTPSSGNLRVGTDGNVPTANTPKADVAETIMTGVDAMVEDYVGANTGSYADLDAIVAKVKVREDDGTGSWTDADVTNEVKAYATAKLASLAAANGANITLPADADADDSTAEEAPAPGAGGGIKGITSNDTSIGTSVFGDPVTTADGTNGLTVTAKYKGVAGQISGLTLSVTDSEGNVKKSANAALDAFKTTIYAKNESAANEMTFQVGAGANQAITVGLDDMRSEALGLKGSDGKKVSVATQDKANAAVAVFDNAIQKVLDQQATIGAIESRLEYTSQNLTTSSENVQAAESTIRDADMAKEMTNYTKNNVLLQAAQSMLAQANQNSSAVLSLLQ